MRATVLPTNDLAFGAYPQRDASESGMNWLPIWPKMFSQWRQPAAVPANVAQALACSRSSLRRLDATSLQHQVQRIGRRLRLEGLSPTLSGQALAAAGETMRRSIGMEPYDTQILAALQLLRGHLVEMQTGEGKTLAAALAAAIAATAGSSVFVLTVNDYLITRDYQQLAPFFGAMGLSVGVVTSEMDAATRLSNWRHDIVYTSARDLAFDYLRDHIRLRGERESLVNRALSMTSAALGKAPEHADGNTALVPGLCFCLVDEADSLLLDEATVPLLLAEATGKLDARAYLRAYELATQLKVDEHYRAHPSRRRVVLSDKGRQCVEHTFADETGDLALRRRAIELVETALAARSMYRVDRDYAVLDGQIVLIDELTGRVAVGRQWQGGLQAMVQIKEGLEPTPGTRTSAQITYQSLFPRFMHLSGMSGTLSDAAGELRTLYRVSVTRVPLGRPSKRIDLGTRVFSPVADRWQAVVNAVRIQQQLGRPVLVGNASVADTMLLSGLLDHANIDHQVLNATQSAHEAATLERAGRAGVVTVTTNMAGRGTDIKLSEIARRNGGLHVVATMHNRSRRIDRQLFGRAARQGDPGSYQFLVSIEDRLIHSVWPVSARRLAIAIFTLTSGRPQAVFRAMFALAQHVEERRDRSARQGLRAANQTRHRQLGFAGRLE